MSLDFYVNEYPDLFEELMRWKIVTVNELYRDSFFKSTRKSFVHLIKRLENSNILSSRYYGKIKQKMIFPTKRTIKHFNPVNPVQVDEDTIYHDAVAVRMCKRLLEFDMFSSVELAHEYINSRNWDYRGVLDPDALLFCNKKRSNFKIGFEVELHQKCRERVYEKMEGYARSEYFDYALYFFNRESIFRSYIKRIEELKRLTSDKKMRKAMATKIILMVQDDVFKKDTNLKEAKVYLNEKIGSFDSVILN